MYIYIYIYVVMHLNLHIHIYIYIYIYMAVSGKGYCLLSPQKRPARLCVTRLLKQLLLERAFPHRLPYLTLPYPISCLPALTASPALPACHRCQL